jgi:hypothetical protein
LIGCSIDQLVPCDNPFGTTSPWRNFGRRWRALIRTLRVFLRWGLITEDEYFELLEAIGESLCARWN